MSRSDFPDGRFTMPVINLRAPWFRRWSHTQALSAGRVYFCWPLCWLEDKP